MMSKFPDELTCDMAETYGIFDIKSVPVQLLATLAVGLRDDSRVKMAMSGMLVDYKTMLTAVLVDLIKGMDPHAAQSTTACCFKNSAADQRYQTAKEHEIFESPEAFKTRWAEVTRN